MFRAGISKETLLSISCIKGLSPEILLFKRKGTVSRDFSLCDGILPTAGPMFPAVALMGGGAGATQPLQAGFPPPTPGGGGVAEAR